MVDEQPPIVAPAPPLKPTITVEEGLHTAAQRRIDLTWETVQGLVTLLVTAGFVYCQVSGIEAHVLETAFFTILTFYFVRTNHQRVGGTVVKQQGR